MHDLSAFRKAEIPPPAMLARKPEDAAMEEEALRELLLLLKKRRYAFVTPTPLSHSRILARDAARPARDLRDVFGWNRPFSPDLLDRSVMDCLKLAEMVEHRADGMMRSRVRVSSLDDDLFLHSSYPTVDRDAVFFGPDSYRFARLIRQELAMRPARRGARIADMGAGTGVGAIAAARSCPQACIVMTDVNASALRFARINAGLAGFGASYVLADTLDPVAGDFDLIVANPPYIRDRQGRAYRDGGDGHGAAVAWRMAESALSRLKREGRLLLYTGSAIVGGADALRARLSALAESRDCTLCYSEIDPDIFGEELESPAYRDVERIALVAAIFTRRN
ncbi:MULTISPECIES: methyltransferase [unclassified Sphingobium]|uniref:methyltransferase n=1 Tax=unclassified Sphingobium TaxID=2611147 RepID=UPI000A7084D0|nr:MULTISPECIES: class I SAM-dependent methyltransferase [unclassified Sphingobium]